LANSVALICPFLLTSSWSNRASLRACAAALAAAAYKSVGFDEADYALLLSETLKMDGLIRHNTAIMDTYDPQKRVALVVDEWGAWYAPLPGSTPGFLAQQNSIRDALIAALNINIFARHADRVRMANIAQMINVLQAMILTENEKIVLTPTYHVFRMYVPFQDATFAPVGFDAGQYTHGAITLPRIDAMAAKDASGTLWLSLTNLDQPLFDGAGATKRDLVEYLDGVRDRILPPTEAAPASSPRPVTRQTGPRRMATDILQRRTAGADDRGLDLGDRCVGHASVLHVEAGSAQPFQPA